MTLSSMTGFAREAGTTGAQAWAWEVRCVNGRGLDVRLRTPAGLDEAGEEARRQIAAALGRGQCQVTLTVTSGAAPERLRVNRDALATLLAAVAELDRPASVGPATLDGLLAIRGVVELDETGAAAPSDALKADLTAALPRLLASLVATRRAEGVALGRAIGRLLDDMERLVDEAETCPARRPDAIRARLAEQVATLLGHGRFDPERLHAEAALIATRADIREELDRLGAHLDAARTLLGQGGAVGRRLDFLAQEFGREANTLCAKAGDVSLSRIGLDLKAVVEQFREQVQNVE